MEYGIRIKYAVEEIPEKGLGVIAKQFIPKGTVMWILNPTKSMKFTEQDLKKYIKTIPRDTVVDLLIHMYGSDNDVILGNDDFDYINHSKTKRNAANAEVYYMYNNTYPEYFYQFDYNTKLERNHCSVALRDIQINEEILESYNDYDDPAWWIPICNDYGVMTCHYIGDNYD